MTRHTKSTKRPIPTSTLGASGLLGLGALLLLTFFDRPMATPSPDRSTPKKRRRDW
jgi:hypothetical protein